MLRGPFNPYAVVHRIRGVFDPRANYKEYRDIKTKMRTCGVQQELDEVKLKLAAFYIQNPRNPRDEDEPSAIVYLDDEDERLVEAVDPYKLSDYLLYRSQ